MSEIITDKEINSASTKWTIAALIILLILAALYAINTNRKIYVKPMDTQSLPKAPEMLERESTRAQLKTQSSQNQPVSSSYSSQLQTGSSSVQQASPNAPQYAGMSNPSDIL